MHLSLPLFFSKPYFSLLHFYKEICKGQDAEWAKFYIFKDILVFKWLVPLEFVHQAFPNEYNYIISRPTKWKLYYSAYVFSLGKRENINHEYVNWK